MKKKLFILIIIVFVFSNIIFTQQELYKLNKFKYEITIESRMLPLFVVDKNGNPIFDLKKTDLKLFVNGKETDISYLINHKIGFTSKDTKEVIKKVYKKKTKQLERLVFIVFDTIFNSRYGMKRMKKVAQEIVKSASMNDYFMIIGIDEQKGLYPIYGPSKKGKKLLRIIKRSRFFSPGERLRTKRKDIENPGNFVIMDTAEWITEIQKERQADILAFTMLKALDNLKKVIDRVTKPKIVYIFSEGITNKSIYKYGLTVGTGISKKMEPKYVKSSIVGKLINTINILNKSGGSMYIVNPGRVRSEFGTTSGKMSLKIIARETGGEYFEGTKVKTIVENVKKITDAYYELFFTFNKNKNKTKADAVKIVSINRNIKIYTPKSSVAAKDYGELSIFEKKLHIIGLIEGNKWNSIYGNVLNKSYKRKIKLGNILINVEIPEDLLRKHCDIYKIRLKKKSREPEIIMVSKNLSKKEVIVFNNVSDELLFFVIISKHSHKSIVGRVE